MVTNIIEKLTFAPCKSITLPCTFLREKFRVFIVCLLTSILSCGATTESKIIYPKPLLTGVFFIIVFSPLTPMVLSVSYTHLTLPTN